MIRGNRYIHGMMKLQDIKTLVFDLDGTLWSPLGLSLEAWRRSSAEQGIDPAPITPEKIGSLLGKSIWEFALGLFGHLEEQQLRKLCDRAMELEVQLICEGVGTLYDRVEEVLHRLAEGYPLYMVSNCQRGYIEAFLETYQMNHLFRAYTCSGDTGRSKDENLIALIEEYGLVQPVYIGDTDLDRQAASAAGIPFVYASYGFGSAGEDVKYEIDSIEELLDLF